MSKMVDLTDYTEEELVALNQRIVERLRSLHQHRCHKEMARFNLGDTVSFAVETGRIVVGKVIRSNMKTITVISSSGEHWRVSPGLLAHTTEGEQTGAGNSPGHLIELHGERSRRR